MYNVHSTSIQQSKTNNRFTIHSSAWDVGWAVYKKLLITIPTVAV